MQTGSRRGSARLPGCLLDATQLLISGQSRDLALEGRDTVTLDEVIDMEAGKTAALLACADLDRMPLAAGADDISIVKGAARPSAMNWVSRSNSRWMTFSAWWVIRRQTRVSPLRLTSVPVQAQFGRCRCTR